MYIGNEELGRRKKSLFKKLIRAGFAPAYAMRKAIKHKPKRKKIKAKLIPITPVIKPPKPLFRKPAYIPEEFDETYLEPIKTGEEFEEKASEVEAEIENKKEMEEESLGQIAEFPSVEKAIAYIKSKVADLFKQDLVLQNQMTKVKKLKEVAKIKGDDKRYAKLIIIENQIKDSLKRQKSLESKVTKMGSYAGLSAIPLVIIAIAIPTAVLLALHYKKIKAQEKSLSLIEKGLLTPEEARVLMPSLFPSFADIGTSAKYIAILGIVGIGGYMILTRKK